MNRRRLTYPIVALCAFALMGQDSGCDTETSEPADDARPAQPAKDEKPEPATPDPKGTFDGNCDYLLGDGENNKFVAGGTVENTGNVGIVANVTAKWTLLGGEPATATKKVRLKRGASKDVQLSLPASTQLISQHQSADGKCDTKVEIVDTFGKARD